ncbi:YbaB/EbfC family nucleoid-associated protein [Helicobacter kayseriensis]|uniref:YbaB/EbfC family nucleoid-associated protein n=1 Tax=Helicobacter kayseriensis TaxID=2905877 RepID=UPI001E60DA56|nr:YbaB/EbfC family nucleoid-associated protein [Helicobacter kayseriensis]MCE3046483.1 YbaB/EbfC family nucleoid-associated protein [Helicobacter kayseriensis]MCE3048214.1 YbaB/EbfC family nucleoid-associated protein [Helicobacter kayseriensis]
MFDPNKLTEMLGNFQEKAKELEEKNKNKIYTSKSGGGLVSVSMNGSGEMIDLNIDSSLLEDKESLQILLISAINDAYHNINQDKKNEALNMLGGLNLFGQS